MKKRRILLVTAILALCLLVGCGRGDTASESSLTFTANTLDGGTFTQDDIAQKDVTIINFWGTFCSPCISEMPDLAAYAKALPDNVRLITICTDGSNKSDDAKAILENAGYDGITLVSGDQNFVSLCRSVQAIPTTITLNSEGDIIGKPIIGTQKDLFASFTTAVNQVLIAEGKAEITVAAE